MAGLLIDAGRCVGCRRCERACAFGGIAVADRTARATDACTLCGGCVDACPVGAISIDRAGSPREPEAARRARLAAYRGVWVFAQLDRDRRVLPVAFELLAKARELADGRGCAVSALLAGPAPAPAARQLIEAGADTVYACDDPRLDGRDAALHARWVGDLIASHRPETVLFGATPFGRELAPMVAQLARTGLTADCTALALDAASGLLEQTRPAFGGNLMATITCPEHRPQMATVRPGVFAAAVPDAARTGSVVATRLAPSAAPRVRLLDHEASREGASLAGAERLVVIGRGIGSKKNVPLMRHLADALGAQLGCTRPLVESGWLEYPHQVGQTGVSVAPKLLLSIGVSGAIQHVAGIGGARTIVAVNEDPSAPIFGVAHYQVVGDAIEIAEELVARLEDAS